MNLILSDVEETIYVVEADEMTGESVVRVCYLLQSHTSTRAKPFSAIAVGLTDC